MLSYKFSRDRQNFNKITLLSAQTRWNWNTYSRSSRRSVILNENDVIRIKSRHKRLLLLTQTDDVAALLLTLNRDEDLVAEKADAILLVDVDALGWLPGELGCTTDVAVVDDTKASHLLNLLLNSGGSKATNAG